MASSPIVWYSSSRTPDGYGDEARAFLGAMEESGLDPALVDYSDWSEIRAGLSSKEESRLLLQEGRVSAVDPLAAINVHHYVPGKPLERLHRDIGFNVSRSMFETDRIPFSWLPSLSLMDEIWVPTQFNVESFAYSGVAEEKLRVLGGTLDFDFFDPNRTGLEPLIINGVPEESFVFLSNFDFSERKGWQCLLTAWAEAFSPQDPVCLVLKTASLSSSVGEIEKRIGAFWGEKQNHAAPVVVLNSMLDREQMAGLYMAADAFVLPSRGEGWGRPYMEALAMGLPTIASDFSAHLEFVRPEYAWLVGGHMVPVPRGLNLAGGLYDGHKWFDADPNELTAAMREVASDPASARAKAAPARGALLERFSPSVIAGRIDELTEDLVSRRSSYLFSEPGRMSVRARTGRNGTAAQALAIQGRLEEKSEKRYKLTNQPLRPELEGIGGISFSWGAEAAGENSYLVVVEDGASDPGELARVANRFVDLLITASSDRSRRIAAAGMPPGRIKVVGEVDWARSVSKGFTRTAERIEGMIMDARLDMAPPVAGLQKLAIEGREKKVLWAPDLTNNDWERVIHNWGSYERCRDATLSIWLGATGIEQDAALDVLGAAIEGIEEADLLVLEASPDHLAAVALTCGEVILEATDSEVYLLLERFASPLKMLGK